MWDSPVGELVRSLMGERLTDIAFWFDPELASLGPECIQFSFGSNSFWVIVHGEDDTVILCEETPTNELIQDLPQFAHLKDKIRGLRMRWTRIMFNQQGYQDGIQIDFESDNYDSMYGLELVAIASVLEVRLYMKQ